MYIFACQYMIINILCEESYNMNVFVLVNDEYFTSLHNEGK